MSERDVTLVLAEPLRVSRADAEGQRRARNPNGTMLLAIAGNQTSVRLRCATSVVEEVRADKEPLILEKDGKAVAALVSMEDLDRILLAGPSKDDMARALRVAGQWKDMDTNSLIDRIYRARHESPPSLPVNL